MRDARLGIEQQRLDYEAAEEEARRRRGAAGT